MSRMLDQIQAAQELTDIYTEWKINPDFPENAEYMFSVVMGIVAKFVGDE